MIEFREMRRKNQALDKETCIRILQRNSAGVLSVCGDNDYPYGVPLNYVYKDGKIYFHCAKTGHKLDAINKCSKVSFCVIDKDEIVPSEYTSYFRSVILFGKAKILTDPDEIFSAIDTLSRKYTPDDSEQNRANTIKSAFERLCMAEITIDHMTGKEAIELVRAKNKPIN